MTDPAGKSPPQSPQEVPPKLGERARRKQRQTQTQALESGRPYQPKRQRRMIRLDKVNPNDLAKIDVRFFCDQCSHYSPSKNECTMGYVPQHTKALQMPLYNLTGAMAHCRFMEID